MVYRKKCGPHTLCFETNLHIGCTPQHRKRVMLSDESEGYTLTEVIREQLQESFAPIVNTAALKGIETLSSFYILPVCSTANGAKGTTDTYKLQAEVYKAVLGGWPSA